MEPSLFERTTSSETERSGRLKHALITAASCRSVDGEGERRVYMPTFAKSFDRRELPVRPVSARTYQQLISPGDTCSKRSPLIGALRNSLFLVSTYSIGVYSAETEDRPTTSSGMTFAEKRKAFQSKTNRRLSFQAPPVARKRTDDGASGDNGKRAASLEQKLKAHGMTTFFDPLEETHLSLPKAAAIPYAAPPLLVLQPGLSEDERAVFLTKPGGRQHPFACYILRDRQRTFVFIDQVLRTATGRGPRTILVTISMPKTAVHFF